MRQTQKLKDLHSDAILEFDEIIAAQRSERMQALQDRRFYSIPGAMWEGSLAEAYANKPKLEVNKVHLAVIRIINEYRNNRITVDFISKDGSKNEQLADSCDALYRATEQDSVAEEAYDNAFEEAVGGGMGAWRLIAEYEDESDEENEKQRICIKPIFDADSSVYFDLDAKRQDKGDARRCFVITPMTHGAYKAEWGKEPSSLKKDVEFKEFDWYTPDSVYVAELYEKETEKQVIHFWENIATGEIKKLTEDDYESEPESDLKALGWQKTKTRTIKRKRVHKYIMDGKEVLEDCGLIAGEHIPVVPTYGKRWVVDGIERFMGHVRLAKDAQRLKNVQLSSLAEIAALSPIEKPILFPEQVAGHELLWAEDNIKPNPFLPINPIRDDAGNIIVGGPIAYTKPPTLSPAMAALLQITEQDMADILGNQQNGEKMEANQSGKAVELIQTRLDMQAFIYMSNMSKAVKRSGEIWLSMAKDLFVEKGRKLKGITRQGAVESLELMRPIMKDGKAEVENDLSNAEFDVAVDVGPSSESKRSATVKALTNIAMISEDPETKKVLLATAMQNMEGEGLADLREYYRSMMVKMGVIKPTDEEAKKLAEAEQNAKPDPNTQYLEAAAKEAAAKAQEAASRTMLNVEKSALTQAQTMETLAKVDEMDQAAGLQTIEQMQQQAPEMAPVEAVVVSPDQIGQ
jgi:hypothetical protein